MHLSGRSTNNIEFKCANQLVLNEENIKYFENGTLDKIIGNKAKDSYCFYIKLDTIK